MASVFPSSLSYPVAFATTVKATLAAADYRDRDDQADRNLNEYAVKLGVRMAFGMTNRYAVAEFIRRNICGSSNTSNVRR